MDALKTEFKQITLSDKNGHVLAISKPFELDEQTVIHIDEFLRSNGIIGDDVELFLTEQMNES